MGARHYCLQKQKNKKIQNKTKPQNLQLSVLYSQLHTAQCILMISAPLQTLCFRLTNSKWKKID